MKWGIDVSEHNQPLSWQSLKKQGASFVIVRLGWGKGHLDSRFYEQVNGVLAAGLELGIYYYSYALTEEEAAEEARFTAAGPKTGSRRAAGWTCKTPTAIKKSGASQAEKKSPISAMPS